MAYNDRWLSEIVICKGGLDLSTDALTQGAGETGSAVVLQNFEQALEGGYRRINGYTKYDPAEVPGDADTPILGVKVALGGVFAARYTTTGTDNAIYFSAGLGWGTKINPAARTGSVSRVRFTSYSLTEPVVIGTDGANPAFKYDGTTYTLLNGAGAPVNPKYAELHKSRLVLSGYTSNTSAITLSAPNDDEDYSGASGAIEINVGDTVVGLKTFRDVLYIFCANSIWKLTGETSANFAVVSVVRSIGCISGDTIEEVGGDLVFLAPDGFRSIAGTDKIGDVDLALLSRKIQPIIRDTLGNPNLSNAVSVVIRKKSQYRCFFYDPMTDATSGQGVIGKLQAGQEGVGYAWSTIVGMQPYCADSSYDTNNEVVVFGHPSTGYVYSMESGIDFDGTDIDAVYSSPQVVFKDATIRKVMQKAKIFTQAEGNFNASLALKFDYENLGIQQPPAMNLDASGSYPVYGEAVYDTSLYSSVQFPVFMPNLIGSGFTCAFNFSSSGGAPYRIDSYQVVYSQKGYR